MSQQQQAQGRQFGSTFTGIQGQYGAPVPRGNGGNRQVVTLQQLEQRQSAVLEAEHHWRVLGILQHLFGPSAPKVRERLQACTLLLTPTSEACIVVQ